MLKSLLMAPQGGKKKPEFLVMTLALFFVLGLALAYPVPGRNDYENEIFYMNGNIRCLRCSPGEYVLRHCTIEDTWSTCASCDPGHTYSEYLTGLTECLECKVCRADQIKVSPCTTTKNTVCQCKEGTYCPSEDSCEICQKCTTSCPPNEVEQAPCNSTNDMQCAVPESGSNLLAILVPVGVFFVLFTVAVVCVWYFCKKKPIERSKWLPKILTVPFKCEGASAADTETPFLSHKPTLRLKENITENETNEAINNTFTTFVELVPVPKFDRFARELGLSNNEIENIREDHRGAENQRYTMLSQLHMDDKFDVNIWLSKLDSMKLGKVAKEITAKLIEDERFERTT